MIKTNNQHITGNFGLNLGEEFIPDHSFVVETNIGEKMQKFSLNNRSPMKDPSSMGMESFYVYITPNSSRISEIVALREVSREDNLSEIFGEIRKYLSNYGESDLRRSIGMLNVQRYVRGLRELRFETEKTSDGHFRIFLRYIDNEVKMRAEKENIAKSLLS